MSVVHVIEWYLWVILIDLECLKWKWTTSHSLPISSSSCSSWHIHSFEMALWKVKNWDMFIHSVVWVPASSTWLSLGKLWKQVGFVIKFLLFAICYVFVNVRLTGRTGRRTGRPSLCSVLLCTVLFCTAILEEDLEEELKDVKDAGKSAKDAAGVVNPMKEIRKAVTEPMEDLKKTMTDLNKDLQKDLKKDVK